MVRLTLLLLIYFGSFTNSSYAQPNNYYIKLSFDEWMDTTGFSNPNNFTWSDGLITLSSSLIDTSTALLAISQPQLNKWYKLEVFNVYDWAGNLINPENDTASVLMIFKPLPVELSSFNAKIKDQKVRLNWTTETEVNNYGFDIERSTNEIEWMKIGFVKGYGNSNSPKSYTFDDENLYGGSRFKYRLKQIDTDGAYEYSDEVEVEIIPDKYAIFQNYPNPFNPVTKIRYQLPEESNVEINIYDITGAQVTTILNENKQAGTYEAEFNAHNLASGVYLYRIIAERTKSKTGETFIETKKMVLIR